MSLKPEFFSPFLQLLSCCFVSQLEKSSQEIITSGSTKVFQLTYDFTNGRACLGFPFNTPLNKPS